MSRIETETGIGYSGAAPSESYMLMRKSGYRPAAGAPSIVSSHTAGFLTGPEPIGGGPGAPSFLKIYQDIVDQGFILDSGDEGGRNFGNDTGMSRLADVQSHVTANGGWSHRSVFVGMSMGGLLSLCAALPANRSRLSLPTPAGLLLFCPVSNLQNMWLNPTFTSQVNTAYGGSYVDATSGAAHNPATFGASLAGIPTMLVYDLDDSATIIPSTVTTLAGLIGSSCTLVGCHSDGAHGGESEMASFYAKRSTYLAFLDTLKEAAA